MFGVEFMIKVLHIGLGTSSGGVAVFILNHYKELNPEQVQFDFISMSEHIPYEEEIKSLGGTIIPVVRTVKNPLLTLYQIYHIITKNQYDVVHIHISNFANIIPLLGAKLSGCKHIILHSHNNGMNVGILKTTLHNINRCATSNMKLERLACSKNAGEFMFGVAPFTVFENAIAKEKFYYNEEIRKQVRNDYRIPESSFVIGNVGRLVSQKNHSFLLQMFAKYLKINPDAYLFIVGDGVLYKQLHTLAHHLNIDSKVIFTGFQFNVSPYYQAMDVFCLPSVYEGLGIVGIEAQMSGLPCIFSDKCVEEVNVSGKSIYLPLNDIDEWVHRIHMQYLSRNLNVRDISIRGYDIKENVKKLEKIYTKKI